jgi:hypothetical protein
MVMADFSRLKRSSVIAQLRRIDESSKGGAFVYTVFYKYGNRNNLINFSSNIKLSLQDIELRARKLEEKENIGISIMSVIEIDLLG